MGVYLDGVTESPRFGTIRTVLCSVTTGGLKVSWDSSESAIHMFSLGVELEVALVVLSSGVGSCLSLEDEVVALSSADPQKLVKRDPVTPDCAAPSSNSPVVAHCARMRATSCSSAATSSRFSGVKLIQKN